MGSKTVLSRGTSRGKQLDVGKSSAENPWEISQGLVLETAC